MIRTVNYVIVKHDPLNPLNGVIDPEGIDLAPKFAALPRPFAQALLELATATREGEGRCWECATPMGWVLYEDDDEPRRSGLRWRTAVLARNVQNPAGTVALLCEDCAPNVPDQPVYPSAVI